MTLMLTTCDGLESSYDRPAQNVRLTRRVPFTRSTTTKYGFWEGGRLRTKSMKPASEYSGGFVLLTPEDITNESKVRLRVTVG